MKITQLDHFVLTVKDIVKTTEFYQTILGMQLEIFGDNRICLKFANQKINLHQLGKEFEPKALSPTPGSADLCFITELDLIEAKQQIEAKGCPIIEGPVRRTGACCSLLSIYLRDPDGNLIEIANQL